MTAGFRIFWDGCDDHDRSLPSGTYLYLVATGERSAAGKVQLVK